jgi:cation diffusion facilitator CzcD-associated flavoprotein CzcO
MPSVIIVGAGFGGIGAAIELTRAGHTDVTVLERAARLGGVWRENTYPGAACDVPSPLYSYSYEPNEWPQRYSGQRDIHAYLERTATKYGIDALIRFDTEVLDAEFDAARNKWLVHITGGETLEADVLVPAVGQLSRPALPRIPGLETFGGRAFHSARWDHDYVLRGKRVAVIGTGASAIQFLPMIQPQVAALTVFQRTPPYIGPKFNTDFGRRHAWLRRHIAPLRLASRAFWWLLGEFFTRGMIGSAPIARLTTWLALSKLRREVPDAARQASLTPDYPVGCKRVLFSNDYLPALSAPNVEVVTDAIVEIVPDGVVTADGTRHEVDAIIYGTGFTPADFLAPMTIRGLGGRDLRAEWHDGARAYLGLAVPGFPNLFLMYGPNTNLGAGSIIYMLEAQARYVRQAVELLAGSSRPAYLDVRPEVERRYDAELQTRLSSAVWTMCSSWYRNAAGRVVTNWPGQVIEYHRRTKVLVPGDYRFVIAPADDPALVGQSRPA